MSTLTTKKVPVEALNARSPGYRPGFYYSVGPLRTKEVVFVLDADSHREAVVDGYQVVYLEDLVDGVHELDFRWGDQRAAAFLLVKGGKKIDYIQGCGDRTPYVIAGDAECIARGKIVFSNPSKDQEEIDQEFWNAAERIRVDVEYSRLCHSPSHSTSERRELLRRQIEEAVVRFAADDRANADRSGVLRRLLRHYRRHQNPLRSLRSEKGGIWKFHREPPSGNLPEGAVVYHGDSWWVVWCR